MAQQLVIRGRRIKEAFQAKGDGHGHEVERFKPAETAAHERQKVAMSALLGKGDNVSGENKKDHDRLIAPVESIEFPEAGVSFNPAVKHQHKEDMAEKD